MTKTVVSTWHGTYLLDGPTVVREAPAPEDPGALAERTRRRLEGRVTAEEESILALRGEESWTSGDRRLVGPGVEYDPQAPRAPDRPTDPGLHRSALLRCAETALQAAWDPSVHVEEAVRALRDIDRAANLLGERISSWAARDAPELEGVDHLAAARALLQRTEPVSAFAPDDPSVTAARRRLAELVVALADARATVEAALRSTVPVRAPNLNRLLGPELAARLVAQAGGLDRLAHLPASTVQVLGAERAFFEHLRGRAPPPRHGLLFLHPALQSAPRAQRGKLARALAAKAAIAARLDRAGGELDPSLAEAFERRRAEIRSSGPGKRGPRGRGGLRPPLDRAARDR
jgi:nucleolar protein 56